MRLHTKILLLMLAITIGSSAVVSWMVTLRVTAFETERADEQASLAILHYRNHVEDRNRQISMIVRILLEGQAERDMLRNASANGDIPSKTNLTTEVLGREVPGELEKSHFNRPSFQLIVNEAGELVTSLDDPKSVKVVYDAVKGWIERALKSADPVTVYVITPTSQLTLVLGVPVRSAINDSPDDMYFLAYQMDDQWLKEQLLAERKMTESTSPPLTAWFYADAKVLALASSDSNAVNAAPPSYPGSGRPTPQAGERVEFSADGERFTGRAFNLEKNGDTFLVLATSQDKALAPLRALRWKILLITLIACGVAVVACRFIAAMISRPINELVAGTRRIAAAQFDQPVQIHRRDELGVLSDSFNKMAQGLKERDNLREQRVKLERDMAVARKIQMDVLPKSLPPCPGYDLAAFSHPAEQTGGDIYDLVALALDPPSPSEPPSLVLLLADAAGHGIGPALSVTQVRAMLRIGMRLRAQLDDVFAQINRQLCQDLDSGRFVTAFLGLLDSNCHSINYHSAGQGPLLHFHGKNHRFEWLDSSMLPLGLDEEAMSGEAKTINVEPGDLIVLLTDGFYECVNGSGQLFGRERITEIILQHHHRPARDLLNEILAASRVFAGTAPQEDDMTGVIIRRLPTED